MLIKNGFGFILCFDIESFDFLDLVMLREWCSVQFRFNQSSWDRLVKIRNLNTRKETMERVLRGKV
jgi:hypothetical protein